MSDTCKHANTLRVNLLSERQSIWLCKDCNASGVVTSEQSDSSAAEAEISPAPGSESPDLGTATVIESTSEIGASK